MSTTPATRCRIRAKSLHAFAVCVLLSLPCTSALRAEKVQVWAKGVTAQSGWQNTFQFKNGCWAGCSTDMIDWWQKRIAEKYDYSGIKVWDREELIREYDTNKNFGDKGDYVWRAIEWVMKNTVKRVVLNNPGYQYLTNTPYNTLTSKKPILYVLPCYDSDTDEVERALNEFVDAGGNCIASIRNSSHAYTLYGVEYEVNAEGKRTYLYLYITDPTPADYTDSTSSYNVPTLHRVTLNYNPNYKGRSCLFGSYWITMDKDGAITTSQCEVDPFEFTFLRIDDELLVDKDGKAAFTLLSDKGDTPAFNPVRPGEEQACATRPEAEKWVSAVNQDKSKLISPPDKLPEGFRTRYANLFEAQVRERADGQFAVAVALKAEAEESVREGIEGFGNLDVKGLSAQDQEATVQTVPGLYYSVLAGSLPGDLAVKSCTMAEGETLKLAFPKLGKSAFYQIKTTVSAETVAP